MAKKLTAQDIIEIWNRNYMTDDFDFKNIYPFLEDKDIEIRSAAVKILIDDDSDTKENLLLDLFYEEEDEIIRCDIVNSFLGSKSQEVLETLLDISEEDESHLVRAYGVMFYWEVFWNINQVEDDSIVDIFDLFLLLFSKEESEHVLVTLAEFLYILGDEDKLEHLLDNLDNEDFYIRSSIITSIKKIIDKENIEIIQDVVDLVIDSEEVSWIKRDLEKILEMDIKKMENRFLEDFIYD